VIYKKKKKKKNIYKGKGNYLGYRRIVDKVAQPYEWMTYDECLQKVKAVG